MPFPTIESQNESATATEGTNHTVSLPTGIQRGDLILHVGATGLLTPTINAHADYSELLDEASTTGLRVLYRYAQGGETNPTFVTTANTRSAWVSYRISGHDPHTVPQIGTTATGSSVNPNPPASASPAETKDFLFIAFFGQAGEQADDDTLVTTFPTNYTLGQAEKTCGTAGTNLGGMIGSAARQLSTGAAEDPGTFTSIDNAAWRAQTIMVHPERAPMLVTAPMRQG